jgi:hypothetical protein
MNEEKENKQNENQTEDTRTMGQQIPGTIMEKRKQHKDIADAPPRPVDATPEELFYNDQNSDAIVTKRQ